MSAASRSLAEALLQFLQSLQLPFLFPAATLILVTLFLFPPLDVSQSWTFLGVVAVVTVILSYLFFALNVPIIRVVEGYSFRESWFSRQIKRIEMRRYRSAQDNIQLCRQRIVELGKLELDLMQRDALTPRRKTTIDGLCKEWQERQRQVEENLELRFPKRPEKMPTALGNMIAAFEEYPWLRYRMDAVHLWPRMLPVLEARKFTAFVQNEKNIMDFLINTAIVAVIIGFELLGLSAFGGAGLWYVAAGGAAFLAAYVLYWAATVAALHWGGMVRVAFDLYRDDLRRALHLAGNPRDIHEERKLWEAVSKFLLFGEVMDLPGFMHPKD